MSRPVAVAALVVVLLGACAPVPPEDPPAFAAPSPVLCEMGSGPALGEAPRTPEPGQLAHYRMRLWASDTGPDGPVAMTRWEIEQWRGPDGSGRVVQTRGSDLPATARPDARPIKGRVSVQIAEAGELPPVAPFPITPQVTARDLQATMPPGVPSAHILGQLAPSYADALLFPERCALFRALRDLPGVESRTGFDLLGRMGTELRADKTRVLVDDDAQLLAVEEGKPGKGVYSYRLFLVIERTATLPSPPASRT